MNWNCKHEESEHSGIDSLWNQATIINNGQMTILNLINDEGATFNNTAEMYVSDLFNEGMYTSSGNISVLNNFSNCNTQTLEAKFINDGIVCVANDLINCNGDSLIGAGNYYVGGISNNNGVLSGAHVFHTISGSLDIPGIIDPGVTVTSGTCVLEVSIDNIIITKVYPNPTSGIIYFEGDIVNYNQVQVFNLMGKEVTSLVLIEQLSQESISIDFNSIPNGIYLIKIESETFRIIKE